MIKHKNTKLKTQTTTKTLKNETSCLFLPSTSSLIISKSDKVSGVLHKIVLLQLHQKLVNTCSKSID